MLWTKIDLPGLIRWAESLDLQTDDLAVVARGFLMSRVNAETRDRWLEEARTEDAMEIINNILFYLTITPPLWSRLPLGLFRAPEFKRGDSGRARTSELFSTWAKWDPKAALKAAAKAGDAGTVLDAIRGATWDYWTPYNMRHCGLGAVKDFPFFSLGEDVQRELASDWSQMVMEEWGDIDIAETARYGLDFMLRVHYAPPENLMAFFSGHDVYPDEGGMIDRTFCALRVWAAVKPNEMKAWIATLQDAEMRQALTWLLEHPWGGTAKDAKAMKPRPKGVETHSAGSGQATRR